MNRFADKIPLGSSKQRTHRRSAEAGFTLLETMVALALCGLIVGALGTATHLYWKYRSLTRGQVHSTHLMRGLVEDLSEDLRSVAPQLEQITDERSHDGLTWKDTSTEGEFQQELMLAHHQLQTAPQSAGFFGTSRYVAVLTEHANSRFADSPQSKSFPEPQYVVWWMNDSSSQMIHIQPGSGSTQAVEISASGIPKGMIRTTIKADLSRSSAGNIFDSQLISSEVNSVTFRFFDGQRWTSDWSARNRREIPPLVEISLTFAGAVQNPASFVVAIPQGASR